MSLLGKLIGIGLPFVPKVVVRQVAMRYVAGERLEAGLERVAALNGFGLDTTLALLGEEVEEEEKATEATAEYERVLRELAERKLRGNVSVKLTLLGLKVDESLARANLERVAAAARELGNFVRIDMEDHTCIDATLRLYHEVQARYGNLGIVLQAYLRRTLGDIAGLPAGTNVRLCKGIYIEPREVAWTDYDTIRVNFRVALERLIAGGAYVAIATHDEYLIADALGQIARAGLERDRYELQTLLGVDRRLNRILQQEGHRLRVYVPYGRDWHAYSVRRLRENPQIAIYVLRAMLGRD